MCDLFAMRMEHPPWGCAPSSFARGKCTMKPIKNSTPIRELQTLLWQWRKKGLKETALLFYLQICMQIYMQICR